MENDGERILKTALTTEKKEGIIIMPKDGRRYFFLFIRLN